MILLIISLVIVFFIGYSVSIFFLNDRAEKIEVIPMAFVVGLMVMGYFILFTAILFGSFADAVWIFMVLGAVYSVYFGFKNYRRFKNFIDFKKNNTGSLINKIKEIPWLEVIFFLIFTAFFFDIFSKTICFQEGTYKVALGGYGDIPFHMSQVSYFIHNNPFALEEPIYSGIKLVYAFMINFLSSVFYVLSADYIFSFNLPSYILIFSGFFFIYKFISAFFKGALMRILTFLVFMLGTGAESIKVFKDPALWEKNSIGEMANYLLHLPYPIVNLYDTVYPVQNNIWSGFMTMSLMHQRSFFFGFAAGAIILYILSEALKNKEKKYFYFIALLIGFLPLVHMHSFIAILLIIFGFYVWKILIGEKVLGKILISATAVGAIIGSIISCFFIIDFSGGTSFLTFRLGWMSEPGIGSIQFDPAGGSSIWAWFLYLWENFGLFIPVFAAAFLYFVVRKNQFWQKNDPIFGLIFAALAIFIIVNIIQFQPWDYDNGKIFGYFYLLGSIIIMYFIEQWKSKFATIVAVALTFFLISAGLIDAFSRSSYAKPTLYGIFGLKEQKAADWIVSNTLSDEIILTGTSHLNPVNSLAGRPVLVGYPGWLWSHGIKYGARENDIFEIYRNGINTRVLLEKYNISYIYVGSAERAISNFNERFFIENFSVVFQDGDIKIYKINK